MSNGNVRFEGISLTRTDGTACRVFAQGETVVCVLPGHEDEIDEFHCDRELVEAAGQWVIQAI